MQWMKKFTNNLRINQNLRPNTQVKKNQQW